RGHTGSGAVRRRRGTRVCVAAGHGGRGHRPRRGSDRWTVLRGGRPAPGGARPAHAWRPGAGRTVGQHPAGGRGRARRAAGGAPDERHSLAIDGDRVVVRAVEPSGVARGLTTLIQLLAAAPDSGAGEARLPGARILDAPRYAWRGLSLDLARAFFTLDEVRRVL